MPVFAGLISDVERIIFSYVTDVSDVTNLRMVNRLFYSDLPKYIRQLNRGNSSTKMPVTALNSFPKLNRVNIPIIIHGETINADLQIVMQIKDLQYICIHLHTKHGNIFLDRIFKKLLGWKPLLDIAIYDGCTRFGYETSLIGECLTIQDPAENIPITFVKKLTAFRPIKHLVSNVHIYSLASVILPSSDIERLTLNRFDDSDMLCDIVQIIERNNSLKELTIKNMSDLWGYVTINNEAPVIMREFDLVAPFPLSCFRSLLHYFPRVKEVPLVLAGSQITYHANHVKKETLDKGKGLRLILYRNRMDGLTREFIQQLYPGATLDIRDEYYKY